MLKEHTSIDHVVKPLPQNCTLQEVQQRHHDLCAVRASLQHTFDAVQPFFSMAIYGSTVYGVSENNVYGNLDDLDMLGVIERTDDFTHIVKTLHASGIHSITFQENAVAMFRSREIDMVRIAGVYQGFQYNLHLCALDAAQEGCHPFHVGKAIRNMVPNTPKYTVKEKLVSTFTGHFKSLPVGHTTIGEEAIIVEFFSRRIRGYPTVDVLAEKFLVSEVVTDVSQKLTKLHERFWTNFVRAALYYLPDDSSDADIIQLFGRAPRFSQPYKDVLAQKIQYQRHLLQSRLKRTATT